MNWISETGGCRLRRRVVAVSAQWLGVGQVSRRRVVAVFGDKWLPSLPSGWMLVRYLGGGCLPSLPSVWVLDRYLGDGWLPSSETGGCRLRPVAGSWSGTSETGGCRLRRQVVAVPQVETKSGESYLDLRLVCAPVSWRLFPGVLCVWAALAFGLLFRFCVWVWSRRVLLALLRCLVSSAGSVSKRGDDPGHRPKDRVFRPWWSK